MSMFVPVGLGIGANVENYPPHQAAWELAMDRLGAQWGHSWCGPWTAENRGMPYAFGPGYVPMLDPAYFGVKPAAQLVAWRDQMIAAGLPWDELSWQFCNEPENSGKTPTDLARLITKQLAEFAAADIRLRIIFPNGNINTEASFRYGVEAFQRVRQAGVFLSPAVHLWCEAQDVARVWSRYRNWIEGYGDKLDRVIVTEAGPGAFFGVDQWLEMLQMVYALLDDPRVGAVAPFAAYPKHRLGIERHPGLMAPDGTLNALGHQYVRERQRRNYVKS